MDASISLPTTPEELTPEWMTLALRTGEHREQQVVDVIAAPIGTGQMCDSFRVLLRYDRAGDGPSSLVAKLPATSESSRQAASAMRCYEKEVRFYQCLADYAGVRTPKVFYGDLGADRTRFVLLLEDLAPALPGDQLAGCNLEMAGAAVGELARLHAHRWDDPTLATYEWLDVNLEANCTFMCELLPALWSGFTDRYGAGVTDDVHRAGDMIFSRLNSYLEPGDGPRTIAHGDFRLDNLLFGADPDGRTVATVVDWQTCKYGAGLDDVAYFLGSGLLPDDRRTHERNLVRSYHDALVAGGVTDYDWDRCYSDYRRGTWSGLLMAVGASMLVERTERGDQMFLTMAARHSRHALDLEAWVTIGR